MDDILRLEIAVLDVVEPEPQVDDLDPVAEGVPPGVAPQRAKDAEPGLIEVVQHEQRHLVRRAQPVDQGRLAVTDSPWST